MAPSSSRRAAASAGKLAGELAAGVALYFAVFVLGPALNDSTSALRLRLAEAGDAIRDARHRVSAAAHRSQIDDLERMVNDDSEA